MQYKLFYEFLYLVASFGVFMLVLHGLLILSPSFIKSRINLYLPFYVGLSLSAAVSVVEFFSQSLKLPFLKASTHGDALFIAGLFLGDFIFCAWWYACDFTKCKMVRMKELIQPCKSNILFVILAFWLIPVAILFTLERWPWSDLWVFSMAAWGLVFLQALWKVFISRIEHID